MTYVLDHATLWLGDGSAVDGHVLVDGPRIAAVGRGRYTGDVTTVDLGGLNLSPGFIDSMLLGGFDKSILSDDVRDIAAAYLRLGVTACQVCAGPLAWDTMTQIEANVWTAMQDPSPSRARVIGIYWEGPFDLPHMVGAGSPDWVRVATPEHVARMIRDYGRSMTMINVAPGQDHDSEAVATLVAAGTVVTMAHSDTTADRIDACLAAGTTVIGHCWNNNRGTQAEPGVVQPTLEHVALTDDRVQTIHLICDGTHVHPVLVRLIERCRGIDAICLVTDCVTRAGCPDGSYLNPDGRRFHKADGVGRTATGQLCGSGLLLPDHWRNFIRFTGTPPAEAVRTVTHNPAASLGLDGEIGLIAPGCCADLALWDDALRLRRVWRLGQELADVSDFADIQLH